MLKVGGKIRILSELRVLLLLQVKEYELSEVFHHSEDDHQYEVLRMEHMTRNTIDVLNNNDIEVEIEEERREQERRMQQLSSTTTHAPLTTIFPENIT